MRRAQKKTNTESTEGAEGHGEKNIMEIGPIGRNKPQDAQKEYLSLLSFPLLFSAFPFNLYPYYLPSVAFRVLCALCVRLEQVMGLY